MSVDGVEITGASEAGFDEILTDDARRPARRPAPELRRRAGGSCSPPASSRYADARRRRHARLPRRDRGRPRAATGRSRPPAPGLVDRRVEITGPTDRKMTINALNSGAKVWLADFEDANTPLWENVVGGQLNLRDALDRHHRLHQPEGKQYALGRRRARHDRRPAARLAPAGEAPARSTASRSSGSPGRLRALPRPLRAAAARRGQRAVLLPAEDGEPPRGAALERRLRPRPGARSASRGARSAPPCSSRPTRPRSRWRRSSTSCASTRPGSTPAAGTTSSASSRSSAPAATTSCCPTATQVTMTVPFMRAYTELLVRTCHKRGAHAIGGMAAFIPSARTRRSTSTAFAKVRGRQDARGGRRLRRLLGRAPRTWSRSAARSSTRCSATGRTSWTSCARTSTVDGRAAARRRVHAGRGHRGGPAQQRQRRHPVPRVLAARARAPSASST